MFEWFSEHQLAIQWVCLIAAIMAIVAMRVSMGRASRRRNGA